MLINWQNSNLRPPAGGYEGKITFVVRINEQQKQRNEQNASNINVEVEE